MEYRVWGMEGRGIPHFFLNTQYSIRHTVRAQRGVTLIDTVVGTALMLVVFLGIAAAFQLALEAVTNNKARAGAIALANERMELLRTLPYSSVGVVGGIPAGAIPQTEVVNANGVSYTRRTMVAYRDDPRDGTGAADTNGITTDYREIRVEVSWDSHNSMREVVLVGRISPPSIETACTSCGILTINVRDAAAQSVSNARVDISNTGTSPAVAITTYTNASGTVSFLGAPAATGYSIVVSKNGYSTARTYAAVSPNTNPSPGHLTVSNNQTTTGTFSIDMVSSMQVTTYSITTNAWEDSFGDASKIGASTNIEVSGNRARFAGIQPWTAPAQLFSETITPVPLRKWVSASWNDTQPAETVITYHIYAVNGGVRTLVPDSVLPGNSAGFSVSPIDISSIPVTTYPSLSLEAYLVALNPSAPSPSIEDWSVSYESGQGISIPFTLQGLKTIGTNALNAPIYKYDQVLTTPGTGVLSIPNLEWDTYTVSVAGTTGYDIASACAPQPYVLAPNASVASQIFLVPHTTNSLLVSVLSGGSALPGASVRLSNGASYDSTVIADPCGHAFFGGLASGVYTVQATSTGMQPFSINVNVTGATRQSATLIP